MIGTITYQNFKVANSEAQSLVFSDELEHQVLCAAMLKSQAQYLPEQFAQIVVFARNIAGGQRKLASALDLKEATIRSWAAQKTVPSIKNILLVCNYINAKAQVVSCMENKK